MLHSLIYQLTLEPCQYIKSQNVNCKHHVHRCTNCCNSTMKLFLTLNLKIVHDNIILARQYYVALPMINSQITVGFKAILTINQRRINLTITEWAVKHPYCWLTNMSHTHMQNHLIVQTITFQFFTSPFKFRGLCPPAHRREPRTVASTTQSLPTAVQCHECIILQLQVTNL